MMARNRRITTVAALGLLMALSAPSLGQITRNNVLLVVNTNSADSIAIRDAYLAKYPGVRVWQYAGSTAASIERTPFESELRVPLDTYLRSKPAGETQSLYKTIRVLVLTTGVPRRIYDIDGQAIGDNPDLMNAEFGNNRFDAASVDSELTLVHQQLRAGSVPQPSGLPKNYANNYIFNPYYGESSRIDSFPRIYATSTKNLQFVGSGWENAVGGISGQLTSGDIYLVTRLSGYTAAEAIAALNRGGAIAVDRYAVSTVFDGDATHVYDAGDFQAAHTALAALRFLSTYDTTATFLTTSTRPVLGYAGYGFNHTPRAASTYVLTSLNFTLAPGALFNTYESYNGRNFETVSPHDQYGQVADWIRIGGTLGLGYVFEPLGGAIARNATLYDRMLLRGWTFAEAAYASMPLLSWQHVVVGDPLTTFTLLPDVTGWQIVSDHGPAGTIATDLSDGYIEPRSQGIRKLTCLLSAAANPATLSAATVTVMGQRTGSQAGLIQSLTLDASGTLLTIQLLPALPNADRYTVTLTPEVKDTAGNRYTGRTSLLVSALIGDANASGTVTATDMLAVRSAFGQAVTAATARFDLSGSGSISADDVLVVRTGAGLALP